MPAFSEKELEKRFLEAGKTLLDPTPLSSQELLHHLSVSSFFRLCEFRNALLINSHALFKENSFQLKLFICLSEVEQSPSGSIKNALSPLMKALVDERLLKHSDVDVKVVLASCITEVTRIDAPVAPYDDDKMKEAFQLIVSSFEHLDDKCSLSYNMRTLILSTLAKCQVCVLMLELGYHALLIDMFQHFLKGLRDHHPMKVYLDMEYIMTLVINKSDDIPATARLLSPILHYVKKDDEVPQISQKLAEQVLINCSSECNMYLAEAVKSSGVSLDKYSDVVALICEGAFSDLKQENVVTSQGINTSKAKMTTDTGKKIASSSKAKPTVPPTKKNTSEIKTTKRSEKPTSLGDNKNPVVSSGKSVSKSKTEEVKQPLEKPPNTNTKRKQKGSDLQKDNENLVGSSIKVWWPMDQKYYKAEVNSYDSCRKRLTVCYEDGDYEILYLEKQKWYLVDEAESSEDQEAYQTGRGEEASTMPQKNKAKTDKTRSANKHEKMDIPPEMLSPIPSFIKSDDEVPQVSLGFAEQVLSSCTSQLKKYLTEAVKSSSVSVDKHSNVVDSICEEAFNALTQEVVANEKRDTTKALKVSTPEQTCDYKRRLNENEHEAVSPRRETVSETGVKRQEKITLEMVQLPVAEEENLGEAETQTHKRARGESSSLHKAHGEMEKTAAEGEPSCRTHKSSPDPKDPQPCSITHYLAKVKQSIVDTITSVRQFSSELETKEQSIVNALTSVRQFRSEIKKKEDNLVASLQEVDELGKKILGINKILNS